MSDYASQLKIELSHSKKVIKSYTTVFNELAIVCQLKLEYSKEDSTLDGEKFIADMDALISSGINPLDFFYYSDNQEVDLSKIMIQLQTFITCYNTLDLTQRIIIYHSYFKKANADKIIQLLLERYQMYSVATIYRKINKSTIILIEKMGKMLEKYEK